MKDYRLVIDPVSDMQFVAHVNAISAAGVGSTAELERALRPSYPEVVVHNGVRDADGRSRWYVYRDGHWKRRLGLG